MLIEFSIGNYASFKDVNTFSMVAANITAKDPFIDENNVFNIDKNLSLLKSAAIYGANASGKSNLAAAIRFFIRFIISSSKETQVNELIDIEPFLLNLDNLNRPSFFEIVFIMDGKKYRYGFEVTQERVVSEWLFFVPSTKEAKLFQRKNDHFQVSEKFKEGKGLNTKTRSNALFLSVVAQFNGEIAQKIIEYLKTYNVISGLNDAGNRGYTVHCLENDLNKDDILKFIKNLDLGIHDIKIEKTPFDESILEEMLSTTFLKELREKVRNNFEIKTTHRAFDSKGNQVATVNFDIDGHESEGTRKLFSLAGPIFDTLKTGKLLFIDEFDARLHPNLTTEIVKLFNSAKTNPHNAQLVFITHDTNLLSNKLFRRDQIWFIEKDRVGASHLYSLAEYKVRNDASFETDYIKGKYGAIPFIGNIRSLFTEENA